MTSKRKLAVSVGRHEQSRRRRARPRKFLVVIDKTPECTVALRFATRRAQHTGGRVTLLCAATPADFQQWRGRGRDHARRSPCRGRRPAA